MTTPDPLGTLLDAAAITRDVAEAAGVRRIDSLAELPPEFAGNYLVTVPAWLFWWRRPGGEWVPQLKPDNPVPGKDGRPVKYVFPSETVLPVGVHPAMAERVTGSKLPLVVVEGTKQYLAAVSHLGADHAAVGLSGCWNWRRKDTGQPVPDLDGIPWDGREVILIFDADRAAKEGVWDAGDALARELAGRGAASVRFASLPGAGDEGLDDVLARAGDPAAELARIIAAATEDAGVRPGLVPPPTAPMAVARQVATDHIHPASGYPVLRHWRGEWASWNGARYVTAEDASLAKMLYERLEHARHEGKDGPVPWAPNRRKVGDVLDALRAVLLLPEWVTAPAWLDGRAGGPVIPCANGLLDVATREVWPPTPAYFSQACVPFACDPAAPEPVAWLRFLAELWPDDPESARTLRQWFGYVLSGRTDLQKALMIVGPPRSGKGTIARILEALCGEGNYAGPLLASLARPFGLADLLGKSLAVIADVRLGPKTDLHTLAERLLSITGEDTLSVERKYKDPVTARLTARFMVLSNELPSFSDVSGALASRFVVLSLTRSWLGHEDATLYGRLAAELPGILNWALDGLADLMAAGHLAEPASSRDARIALADMASPMGAFVREMCTTGPGLEVPARALYEAWVRWCTDNGRDHPGTLQRFSRDIRAVVPGLKSGRPRDPSLSWRDDSGPRVTMFQGVTLVTKSDPGTRRDATQPTVITTGLNDLDRDVNGSSRYNNEPVRVPARPGTIPAPYVSQPPPPVAAPSELSAERQADLARLLRETGRG